MKNKGFTLIELLAVIVILAIIALIATPMILNVVDSAKKSSAESSARYYVEAVENTIMTSQMTGETAGQIPDGEYTVDGKTLTSKTESSKTYTVNYKGDEAKGSLTIAKGQVTTATLTFSKIYAKAVTITGNTVTVAS